MGRATVKTAAAVGAASLSLFGGVTAAHAAPGDVSNASGTFLGGSLLQSIDLDALVNLQGAQATSGGTGDTVTDYNTLDLTALGVVGVEVGGGVQVPIDLGSLGVLGQYASAAPDGSSVGASGAVGSGGVIGTGAPAGGPLTFDLGGAVDALAGSVAAGLVDEISDLDLTLEAVSARASQAAPDGPASEYAIAGGRLVIGSATLAGLSADLNTAVGGVQTSLDGVDTAVNAAVNGLLGALGGVVSTNLTVGTTSLTGAVSDLLTGELTSPDYPGVTIDLSTGSIIVDLDAVQPLNGLAPGTEVLSAATVDKIEDAVLALVDGLVDDVADTVVAAIRGVSVTGGASLAVFPLPAAQILTIDTTVGALLDGDTAGVSLLGVGLTLPGGASAIVAALAAPLQTLVTNVAPALEVVLQPVNAVLFPALDAIVPAVASITVNNQSTSAEGVFSITGAIVTVLPGTGDLTVELANATVGPNALDDNADVTITEPAAGAQIVVPDEGDTIDVTVAGTGEPGAEVTVEIPGQPSQVVTVAAEGTWTATFTDLPVGSYTATATQDVDGTTATVSFEVAAAPDVAITAPTAGQIFVVPGAADVADVTVSGTGSAGSSVEVAVAGQTQTVAVTAEGTWTVTFTDLPVGAYTATATQEIDGSTASVGFAVAETPDVTITQPGDGTEIAVGAPSDFATVTVSGTGSPGATVAVTLGGGVGQSDVVAANGTWSVTFTDLPIGEYTATATQDADGSTATVDFSVVLADAVAITVPGDGEELLVGEPDATRAVTVSGTGQVGAEVEVEIPGIGVQTATVGALGTWTVSFAEIPVGSYTATATQDIDGSTDSVTFSVAAQAADADADATDADAVDADATDADAVDADAVDADAVDADATDADATDADAVDADAVDADATDADATDADATDATDADATDADAVDADETDADATDADATDADATDADATDADATDADATDADATDADATDADASDADATDGGATTQARADVALKQIVRGTGVDQTVIVTGFQPGETVSATVRSTPFELTPVTADAGGTARFTFAIGADFELGDHRVDVRGSVTGELPAEREDTGFTVLQPQAAGIGGTTPVTGVGTGGRLPATGAPDDGLLLAGFAAALIVGGAALWVVRRRTSSGERP